MYGAIGMPNKVCKLRDYKLIIIITNDSCKALFSDCATVTNNSLTKTTSTYISTNRTLTIVGCRKNVYRCVMRSVNRAKPLDQRCDAIESVDERHDASHASSIAFRHLPSNSASIGYATEGRGTLYLRVTVHRRCQRPPKGLGTNHTPSIAFRHLPPKVEEGRMS